jgi:hypothetical protein
MFEIISKALCLGSSGQFSEQIGAAIQQRTHSKVRGLQLDVMEHEITAIGRVGSYCALLSVIEAVKELQAEYRLPVRFQVQVIKRPATA